MTSIGHFAFRGRTSLVTIEIPTSVTSIGEYAFGWCTSLTTIEIPTSVKTVGEFAFEMTKATVIARANTSFSPEAFGPQRTKQCTFVLKVDPFTVVTMAGDTYVLDLWEGSKNLKRQIVGQDPELGDPKTFDLFTADNIKIDSKMISGDGGLTITLLYKSKEGCNCSCNVM